MCVSIQYLIIVRFSGEGKYRKETYIPLWELFCISISNIVCIES